MTIESEVLALRQVPMFRDIDSPRLKLLAFTSERVRFETGQRFFSQGDLGDSAYVILDGKAEVVLRGAGGTEVTVAVLGKNALVGEMAILADAPRTATVRATERVQALRIDKRVFLDLLTQFPQMSMAIMRELARRLERTNAQLVARPAPRAV